MHVTSTRYDNKDAMNLVTESNQAIAIHGCEGNESIAYVGGKDERLKSLIKEQLNHIGIKAKEAPSHISVNRIIILLIVQLEVEVYKLS